jgi:UDP-GlcNAc:undecaprenyl-phosphate GlcNAc-1-phosphate transferase
LNLSVSSGFETVLEVLIVVFFVLGATNSLNLLDGLDGLCAGVTAIITVAMLLLSIHLATWGASEGADPVRIITCLGLVGGVLGFLPFNRHPAKIFMGDAGSMLLGFTVAALMILFGKEIPRWWMASIVAFGLPILDTAVALVRRLLNHRPLFVSDRGHIYDQMIDRGIPLKKTVGICYLLAAFYAIVGVAMSQIRTRYAAVVYLLVFVGSAFAVWKKGYLKMEGLRGAVRKKN